MSDGGDEGNTRLSAARSALCTCCNDALDAEGSHSDCTPAHEPAARRQSPVDGTSTLHAYECAAPSADAAAPRSLSTSSAETLATFATPLLPRAMLTCGGVMSSTATVIVAVALRPSLDETVTVKEKSQLAVSVFGSRLALAAVAS